MAFSVVSIRSELVGCSDTTFIDPSYHRDTFYLMWLSQRFKPSQAEYDFVGITFLDSHAS